ncbi:hypothetical protein ES332_A10G000300v1 [Gossypium tomentosum]|uniref:Uncharacterized protein n=1 Tax=Gossypium tomentosum TaxID=34277 RepID=A0A5D2NKC6_GOSTO|nr:hypothetical protein ES332_A10G000300v1 [Gossypium tomentosum]
MSVWLFLLDALGKKEILVLQDFTSHGLSFTVNYFIIHILYYIDSSQIDTLFPSSYCTAMVDSWSKPFYDAFSESKSLQLNQVLYFCYLTFHSFLACVVNQLFSVFCC